MNMTPERIAEIEGRAAKATPGPWVDSNGHEMVFADDEQMLVCEICGLGYLTWTGLSESEACDAMFANERFIAHARTDIPALLTALKAVTAERDGLIVRFAELESDMNYSVGRAQDAEEANNETLHEVANVLMMLDELADQWGDEGKFRRCRDRLRAIVPKETK